MLGIQNPRLAAFASGLETALLGALATFALNLGVSLVNAGSGDAPFSFNWRAQLYLTAGSTLTAVFKGLATGYGVSQANKGN
jgi:hypothetical protein